MKNTIEKILSVLATIVSIVVIFLIKKVDIIPDKFFIFGLAIILIFLIIMNIVLFSKKNSFLTNFFKVIFIIISIGIIVGGAFGIKYLDKTIHFLGNVSSIKKEVTTYYVMVLKDSRYQEMSDLEKTSIEYYVNTDEEVLNSIKIELDKKSVEDYKILKEDLFNNNCEAIIVNNVIKESLEDDFKEFVDGTRILETIDITKEIEDITKRVSIKNEPFNVLITGIDTKGPINTVSRSDVNMIVTINPKTNEILLTSIPRDYYVQLHGTTGYKDKLTHSGVYGINSTVQTLEDLFGIDINYYVKVNFTTLINLVDAIGGITIHSDYHIKTLHYKCDIKTGNNDVNGECALGFARERYSYIDGDNQRVRNQQEVLQAIFKKVSTSFSTITQYTDILEVLDGEFATNLDIKDATDFIKFEMEDLDDYKFINQQVEGDGDMTYTYTYPYQRLWVMVPDMDTVNSAIEKIKEVSNK